MRLLERAQEAKKLWDTLLPFCPGPELRQFALWTKRFSDEQVERGFFRASRKFSPEKVGRTEPIVVWRYATGVMLREEEMAHAQSAGAV